MRDSTFYRGQLAEAMRGPRRARRRTLQQMCIELGHRSSGYLSEVEHGKKPASLQLVRGYDDHFELNGILVGLHGDYLAALAQERRRGPRAQGVDDQEAGDASEFVSESVDDLELRPGQSATKTWTIRNVGASTWSQRRLERTGRVQGRDLPDSVLSVPVPTTPPGQQVTLAVRIGCAQAPGTRLVRFKMVNAQGMRCFSDYEFGLMAEVTSRQA